MPIIAVPESKPWYLSRSIIGAVVVVIATILTMVGRPEAAESVQAEAEPISGLITQIFVLIGAAVAIYGRIRASTTLTK